MFRENIFFITKLSFLCASIVFGQKKNKEDKNTIFLQFFDITPDMKSIIYWSLYYLINIVQCEKNADKLQ